MPEFSESDIKRWSGKSSENAKLYNHYCHLKTLAEVAWRDNDGAAYTGFALMRTRIREEIGRRMFP